jgi:hypothetical protein
MIETRRFDERDHAYRTDDLLVSDVIRSNEKQVWFVSEHLVDVPLVKAVQTRGEPRPRRRG